MENKLIELFKKFNNYKKLINFYENLKEKYKIDEYKLNIIYTSINNYYNYLIFKEKNKEFILNDKNKLNYFLKLDKINYYIYNFNNYYLWIPNSKNKLLNLIKLGFYNPIFLIKKSKKINNYSENIQELFIKSNIDLIFCPDIIKNDIKNNKITKNNYLIYELLFYLIKFTIIDKKDPKFFNDFQENINNILIKDSAIIKNDKLINYGNSIFGLENKFKNKLIENKLHKLPIIRLNKIYLRIIFPNVPSIEKLYTHNLINFLNDLVTKCKKYTLNLDNQYFQTLIYPMDDSKEIKYLKSNVYSSVYKIKYINSILNIEKSNKIKEYWLNLTFKINPKRLRFINNIKEIFEKELKFEENINYKLSFLYPIS